MAGGYKLIGIIVLISGYISTIFDSIPSIAYQNKNSAIADLLTFRYIRKQIKNTETDEKDQYHIRQKIHTNMHTHTHTHTNTYIHTQISVSQS